MDAITPMSEEEKKTIDDGQDSMTEDSRDGKKQKLYVEKESSEEICVGVSELRMAENEIMDPVLSDRTQYSSQLDKRIDDDVARKRLWVLREVLLRIEEEEYKELRKIEEEIQRTEERIKRVEDLESEKKELRKIEEEMKRKEALKMEEEKMIEEIKRKEELKMKEEKMIEEIKRKEELKMKEEKMIEEIKRKEELKMKEEKMIEEIKRKEELEMEKKEIRKIGEEVKLKEESTEKGEEQQEMKELWAMIEAQSKEESITRVEEMELKKEIIQIEEEMKRKEKLERELKKMVKELEKQKLLQQRREEEAMLKSRNEGTTAMESSLPALGSEVDVTRIGENRTKDHQEGKKGKAKDLNVESSVEPMDLSDAPHLLCDVILEVNETESVKIDEGMENKREDERMDKSDLNLSSRSLKESGDGLSIDKNTSVELMKKEIVPEESDLKESNSEPLKEKEDLVKWRSPVVCVLGHTGAGKTKLLDLTRETEDAETEGITQQIRITTIPQEALREICKMAKEFSKFDLKLPGLLMIDTPGHESLGNLRSLATSLCDVAILVVDIMHGLQPQTIESINLLRECNKPFIVVLNKVDSLCGWKSFKDKDVESTVKNQSLDTENEFVKKCQEVIVQLDKERLKAAFFYVLPNFRTSVSMVPTSAISGDGIGDMLGLIARLTQTLMRQKLVFSKELKATVLEVKDIPGMGTTIDVLLVNGKLNEGDTIVMAGEEEPVVSQIQSLLTLDPLKDMQGKSQYVEHKSIEGAQWVKITGKDLEKAVAEMPLFVAKEPDDVESLKDKVAELMAIRKYKISKVGVYVQASTLDSLEAFLEYLISIDIPYSAVKIGPAVTVEDVMKAAEMWDHFATILALDVKVERKAQLRADAVHVRIIPSDSMSQLAEEYLQHMERCMDKKEKARAEAVFPCICEALTSSSKGSFEVFVAKGYLRVGTPLLARERGNLELGVVASMSAMDGSSVTMAKEGYRVKIRMMKAGGEPVPVRARDRMISRVTRKNYEFCKRYLKIDFSAEEWDLFLQLCLATNLIS